MSNISAVATAHFNVTDAASETIAFASVRQMQTGRQWSGLQCLLHRETQTVERCVISAGHEFCGRIEHFATWGLLGYKFGS